MFRRRTSGLHERLNERSHIETRDKQALEQHFYCLKFRLTGATETEILKIIRFFRQYRLIEVSYSGHIVIPSLRIEAKLINIKILDVLLTYCMKIFFRRLCNLLRNTLKIG